MMENGYKGLFKEKNPGISLSDDVQYIISYERAE